MKQGFLLKISRFIYVLQILSKLRSHNLALSPFHNFLPRLPLYKALSPIQKHFCHRKAQKEEDSISYS
jgi:hypothetical protein